MFSHLVKREAKLPVRERLLGDPDLLDLIFSYLDPLSITSVARVRASTISTVLGPDMLPSVPLLHDCPPPCRHGALWGTMTPFLGTPHIK